MRTIEGGLIQEYQVSGSAYQVVDIPPGYTHSISNVGPGELVTLFWSSEIFNPNHPDTYYLPVDLPVEK
jgi:UDP-2-acetamido-2,6-beta-L-arabino-hexul-4-ose reductase